MDARKRQQELFRSLGTIRRTQINLQSIARECGFTNTPGLYISPLHQRVLDAAVYVLQDLFKASQHEMQNLPSKAKQKA